MPSWGAPHVKDQGCARWWFQAHTACSHRLFGSVLAAADAVALLHAKAQRVMHSTEHVCSPIEVEEQGSPCGCKDLRPPSVAGAQGNASD